MVAFTEAQKREFLVVLQQFGNHISNACKSFGIERTTYYKWLENDPWFKSEIDQINEAELDDAEQMHRYLRQGIPQIVKETAPDGTVIERMIGWEEKPDRYALEFYLSRKGKTRGWGEKMMINALGNVGIGTSSPGTKLDVVGDIRSSTVLRSGQELLSIAGVNQTISAKFFSRYSSIGGTQYNLQGIYATTEGDNDILTHTTVELKKNYYVGLISSNSFFNSSVAGQTRYSIINNGTERFCIDSFNGNVGIANTAPTYSLDVVGITRNKRFGVNGAGAATSFLTATDAKTINDEILFSYQALNSLNVDSTYSSISSYIISPTSGSHSGGLKLSTYNASVRVDAMHINNLGNVGIGVTAPTANLHIGASTTAKALMRLTVGPAPTTPNDGDIWLESNTNTGLKIRIAGVTKTISLV